jgi:hypothetical protein
MSAFLLRLFAMLSTLGVMTASYASVFVSIDTSSLNATPAQLAFDFVDGGSPANTVLLSAFSTDASLGTATPTGAVTGNLPGTLSFADNTFFTEYLQNLTLGSQISFRIDDSGGAADAGSFPDGFAVFLLDPATSLPLVTTSDPTGANALLLVNVGGNPNVETFASSIIVKAEIVPEPSTATFIGILLAILAPIVLRARARR